MEEREFNYINAIPLIDVMLVLLTITLTTATFISQGAIKVNLPTAYSVMEKEPNVLNIYLTSDKKIFIEKIEVTEHNIQAKLLQENRDKNVVINADKTLPIDDLAKLLGHIQNAGFSKMSIKTDMPTS